MCTSKFTDALLIGLLTMVVGLIISRLFMGSAGKEFKHWGTVAGSYFLTGLIIAWVQQRVGISGWYCLEQEP